MYPILIVEDDVEASNNYSLVLKDSGYSVVCVANKQDALAWLEDNEPVLASIDLGLPEKEGGEYNERAGWEVFRRLTEKHNKCPAMFVTSNTDQIDQITAFRMGVWDYITKPIDLLIYKERVARLIEINKSRTSKQREENSTKVQAGLLSLDHNTAHASWAGNNIKLTVAEFEIMALLANNPGKIYSYKELKRGNVCENQAVNRHIANIKQKFKEVDPEFNAIENVFSRGYRFIHGQQKK
ncbi:MAG: hypothetical protein DBP00_03990 [gamma proteobacterium symbiont of Ctena orbiculata]|nr:MAG: hypothetical protein DBP00_03990 [gamma proteobacterium symbiont of Ctena orbiculata]